MAIEGEVVVAGLRAELRHALESGQLRAYFQPQVELSSGRVVGAEALARWEHPELGTLSPVLFIPLAGELGLMSELTKLMLRLSLGQHRTWAARGWSIPVSVNAGPECVTDPGFPAVIAECLRREGVPGHMLVLEVSGQTGTTAVSSAFFAQLQHEHVTRYACEAQVLGDDGRESRIGHALGSGIDRDRNAPSPGCPGPVLLERQPQHQLG